MEERVALQDMILL